MRNRNKIIVNGSRIRYDSDFFNGLELGIRGKGKHTNEDYNIHRILSDGYLIRKGDKRKSKFLGEVSSIILELNGGNNLIRRLNGIPGGMERNVKAFSGRFYLGYFPISMESGIKSYGWEERVPLIFSEPAETLMHLIDRKYNKYSMYKPLFEIPPNYFLLKPSAQKS